MCICINCRHINSCETYKFVQNQHQKNNKDDKNNTSFYPFNTILSVSINKYKNHTLLDWDLKECSSFAEKPGNWLK